MQEFKSLGIGRVLVRTVVEVGRQGFRQEQENSRKPTWLIL